MSQVERWAENQECLSITVVNRHIYSKTENDVSFWTSISDTKKDCWNQNGAKTDWHMKTCHIAWTGHQQNCSKSHLNMYTVDWQIAALHLLLNLITVLTSKPRCSRLRMEQSSSGVTRLSSGPISITSLLWMEELQNEATGYRWP